MSVLLKSITKNTWNAFLQVILFGYLFLTLIVDFIKKMHVCLCGGDVFTGLKCIECTQNALWHSYHSLSMEMNVPTDSRIRVHSVVQHRAELGSPHLSLSLFTNTHPQSQRYPHKAHSTWKNKVYHVRPSLVFAFISINKQICFSFRKWCTRATPHGWFSRNLQQVSRFSSNGKKATQRTSLSRRNWEFDIVS